MRRWIDRLQTPLWIASMLSTLVLVLWGAKSGTNLYFRQLDLHLESTAVLLGLLALEAVWKIVLPFHRSCEIDSWLIVLSNLFPAQLFLLAVFAQYHPVIALVLAVALLVLYLVFRNSQRGENKRTARRIRRRFFVLAAAVLFAVPSVLSLFVYGIQSPWYQARVDEAMRTEAMIWREKQLDAPGGIPDFLEGFWQENWAAADDEQRTALLQQLADYEAGQLGIPPVTLRVQRKDGNVWGTYEHDTGRINIDLEHVESSDVRYVMRTVLHEIYHAYQAYVVAQVDWDSEVAYSAYFSTARSWKENWENYVQTDGSEEGNEAYALQPVEASARTYANAELNYLLIFMPEEPDPDI